MAKKQYLDLIGLNLYDTKIKRYIATSIEASAPGSLTNEQICSLFTNADTSGSLNTITVIPSNEIDNLWATV